MINDDVSTPAYVSAISALISGVESEVDELGNLFDIDGPVVSKVIVSVIDE